MLEKGKDNTKITQANLLIEQKDALSTNEYRLFCEILAVMQKRASNIYFDLKDQEEFRAESEEIKKATIKKLCEFENLRLQIDVKDFISEWNLNKTNSAYRYIIDAVDSFRSKGMRTELSDNMGNTVFATMPFVKIINYRKGEATIDIVVNEFLVPYIAALSREYTIIYLDNMKVLPSANSMRLYELLKQHQAIGKAKWDIASCEKLMHSTYSVRRHFETKVIARNTEIINNLTDLNVSYEITGRGEKSQIEFIIKQKKKEVAAAAPGTFNGLKLSEGVLGAATDKVGEEDAAEYGDFILSSLKEKISSGGIKNTDAYIKTVIENGSLLPAFEEEKKKQVADEKKKDNQILKQYLDILKGKREEEHSARKKLIYQMKPEIESLTKEINELYAAGSKAVLSGSVLYNGVNYSREELQNMAHSRQEKMDKLLDECGVRYDFLEPKYICSKCKDTCEDEYGAFCSCRADRISEARNYFAGVN